MNTLFMAGMMEQIIAGFLDQSEEDEWAEQCMLVESDPGFKHRYGCMAAPSMVDVTGQTTTKVRVFNPYTEPVPAHLESPHE